MKPSSIKALIEALPVHSIYGHEWECDGGCHYHWRQSDLKTCTDCDQVINGDGEFDRDGRLVDHGRLVDLDRVLELLDG